MRVRAKICGITSVEAALAAAEAGCDAVGLMFEPSSPRCVPVAMARAIADALPPLVSRVGVFADAAAGDVKDVLRNVPLDVLQFNGDEPAQFCEDFGIRYVKAAGVRPGFRIECLERDYASARAFLLDTWDPAVRGGTGRTFDWALWPGASSRPLVLAGGLTPANVGAAVRRLRPWAVDVSGGVEDGVKGIKSVAKMRAFVAEVQRAGIE